MSKASMPPSEQDLAQFWHHLSTPHQKIVWEIVQAFVALDTQQDARTRDVQRLRNKGAIALLESCQEEGAGITDEERNQANAELEEFQTALNANRAPEPPLFA